MRLFPGLILAAALTGCAPYIQQHYRMNMDGAEIRKGCGEPSYDWGVFPHHGILIHANVNYGHQWVKFEVPEGNAVRLKADFGWLEQGPGGAKAGIFKFIKSMERTPPDSLMSGKTRVRKFLFFKWRENEVFRLSPVKQIPIEGSEATLVLPELEINGTAYPAMRIPFKTKRTFRFVPLNGC